MKTHTLGVPWLFPTGREMYVFCFGVLMVVDRVGDILEGAGHAFTCREETGVVHVI